MKKGLLLFVLSVFVISFVGCSYSLELLNYGDDMGKLRVAAKDKKLLTQTSNSEKVTALMGFIMMDKPEQAKVLVEEGSDLNYKDRFGRTALMYSITKNFDGLTRAMLDRKPSLGICDNDDHMSALWYAINAKNIKVIKWLVEEGSDVNITNKQGDSVLSFSIEMGQQDIFNYLLAQKGIKIDIQANDGSTPLLYAAQKNNAAAIEALVKAGVKLDVVDKSGVNAVMRAAGTGSKEATLALLKSKVNLSYKDKNGGSALIYAIQNGNLDVISILINAGADINLAINDGTTPLMASIASKNKKAAEMLINKGANVNAKNNTGATALKIADAVDLKDISSLLKSKGAN